MVKIRPIGINKCYMIFDSDDRYPSGSKGLGHIRQHTPRGKWHVFFFGVELEPLSFDTLELAEGYARTILRLNGYK